MLSPEDILLVAGSTHPGEEEIIIGAYKKLLCGFPDLKLLIAPRHPERSRQVSQILFKYDFFPVLISVLSGQGLADKNNPVFVLDTVGELAGFYSAADIVFVGGSLVKKGGHNILEPASFRRPVIFGEYMFNFRNIANMFLENQAAIMAPDADALVFKIEGLLKDKILAQELGDRAYNLIMKNRGATGRNIELIKQQINHWSS